MSNRNKEDLLDNKIFRKKGNILKIGITGTSKDKLLTMLDEILVKKVKNKAKLASNKPMFITTPNPEQVYMAYKDRNYAKILNSSDISICDGVGLLSAYEFKLQIEKDKRLRQNLYRKYFGKFITFIKWFYLLRKEKIKSDIEVIKGRDLLLDLIKIADRRKLKVFLLGSTKRIMERTVDKFTRDYPSVHLKGYAGAKLDSNSVPLNKQQRVNDIKAIRRINYFQPDLLFVAFGAPKQEKWVYRYLNKLNTKIVMVVGGSFDYISGTRQKVPVFFEKLGMEWLWRLLTGSQNLGRIFNAVVRFPMAVYGDE